MSFSITVYNQSGSKVADKSLDQSIFNVDHVNPTLVHEFVLMQLSNARMGNAHSKDRGEVSYSNRKLFKQKGTGNARPGSLKSPLRKQGGVVFGPRNTVNHQKSMTKKARKLATLSSVIMKLSSNEIFGLDNFISATPSTKSASLFLSEAFNVPKKCLIVLPQTDDIVYRSFRNINGVKVITVDYVNPYDVLTHHHVVFVGDALDHFAQSHS